MLKQNQTLQEMIQSRITEEDFKQASDDSHGIVKIIVSATMKERAYDFLHIMMHEDRREYTMNLFEMIQSTPWYDFNQPDGGRFILIWQLETVADEEEITEYFTECMQEFSQDFGDIIIDAVFRDTLAKITRLITHDNQIQTIELINN